MPTETSEYSQNPYFSASNMQNTPIQNAYPNGNVEGRPSYVQPAQPVVGAFEPDDPIPDNTEQNNDRKHRPKFVDFFMRKNSEDK